MSSLSESGLKCIASRLYPRGTFLVLMLGSCLSVFAGTITFEDLPDAYFFSSGDQNIGSFYSGVTFGPDVTGLSVSRFGGYDNAAFPPHSGDVAIWDATDPTIVISFASPISSFGIWYTSFDPLTLQAFDQSSSLLATVIGDPNTDGTTGMSSFLSFSSAGIASIDLTSTPGLFVLDDVTYSSGTSTVPEPNSLVFLTTGLLLVAITVRRTRSRRGKMFSNGK